MEDPKRMATRKLFEVFTEARKIGKYYFLQRELRRGEFYVLLTIYKLTGKEQHGVKILDISRAMEIAPPSVTIMVNNLVKNGYAERRINEEDRRAVQVSLTEKGFSILKKSQENIYNWFEGVVNHLGVEKSNQLASLLDEVCQYLKDRNGENE